MTTSVESNSKTSRRSELAIASLIFSNLSFGLGPLGCIPGIICGHLAKSEIRRDPSLQGLGMAKAGLIIGYIFLGLFSLSILTVMFFFLIFH
jgi:hypothetical protein